MWGWKLSFWSIAMQQQYEHGRYAAQNGHNVKSCTSYGIAPNLGKFIRFAATEILSTIFF